MKKKKFANAEPPELSSLLEANALIRELWEQLREYESRLNASSRNSSRPPSTDSLKDKAERKKLQRLALEIRQALNQAMKEENDR